MHSNVMKGKTIAITLKFCTRKTPQKNTIWTEGVQVNAGLVHVLGVRCLGIPAWLLEEQQNSVPEL